ncbi:MAG: hypothetical protein ACRCS6_09095 [Turicibacter sp.]
MSKENQVRKQFRIDKDILDSLIKIQEGENVTNISKLVNSILTSYTQNYDLQQNFTCLILSDIKETIRNQFDLSYNENAEMMAKISLNTLQTRYILEEMLITLEIDEEILDVSRQRAVRDLRKNYPNKDLLDYFKNVHTVSM